MGVIARWNVHVCPNHGIVVRVFGWADGHWTCLKCCATTRELTVEPEATDAGTRADLVHAEKALKRIAEGSHAFSARQTAKDALKHIDTRRAGEQ